MTWQSGSMRTTGVSVEAITCLSSKLSRISNDRTWWRRSATGSCELSITPCLSSRCSCGDDGSHRFPVQGSRQVARFQTVDHLNRAPVLGILHDVENASFDDHVVQVQ